MNNKGFTLIEILAVVTIMGILTTLAITGYTRYIKLSRNKAYDILAKSAEEAMEEYLMDYPGTSTITFDKLVKEEYLERATDPSDKTSTCKGIVTVTNTSNANTNKLDTKSYEVTMCCINYKVKYKFPGKTKTKYTGSC